MSSSTSLREEVERIAREVPLDAIQLHGDEPPDICLRFGRRAIKAVTVEALARWSRAPESITLLVDASDPFRRGGTGQRVDWEAVAAVAGSRRVILAGGIDPSNVVEAVTTVRPFAIDSLVGGRVRTGHQGPGADEGVIRGAAPGGG